MITRSESSKFLQVITEKDKDKKINLPAKIVHHLLNKQEPEALIVVGAIAHGKSDEVLLAKAAFCIELHSWYTK